MTIQPIHEQIRGAVGLITEEDMAKVLMLNAVSTLATWRSQGKGPAYVKLGKRVFYTVADLRAWAEAQGREQNAPEIAA
jgi:Helix-turn-helix domain